MPEINLLVQTAGTISSLCVSGVIFTFSFGGVNTARLAVPTSPTLASQQWLNVYRRCHKLGTPMVVFAGGCFAWLKYQTNNNAYVAAATSCMSIVPYTILLLSGPEKVLFSAAEGKLKGEYATKHAEVHRALRQWEIRNLLRFMFPLVGGVLVLTANFK